jgi:putative oxidoreductase
LRSTTSAFADGSAGIGLLIMRIACGGVLMREAMTHVFTAPSSESIVHLVLLILATAILTGYWTRIAGAGVAALELWLLAGVDGSAPVHSLLATLGAALALLGPGAWSIDARLSGWRRIHIPRRQG